MEGRKGDLSVCPICCTEFIKKNKIHVYCSDKCYKRTLVDENEKINRCKFTIFERDNFRCVYCGRSPIEDNVKLVLDHIIPYSYIPDNSVYNLITCCDECNISKSKRMLSKDDYERIVKRNIRLNNGITDFTKMMIKEEFNEYFKDQKK